MSNRASQRIAREEQHEKFDTVQLEGQVLMKIIKHCKESFPEVVTGQLLGLDQKRTLEVTNCFPFPRPETNEDGEEEVQQEDEGAHYQLEMMKCLRLVNVDCYTVGWYQSCHLGGHISEDLVNQQFTYQEKIKKSVVLIYDPLRTRHGKLSIRALRLTDTFMEMFRVSNFSQENLAKHGFSFENIFEEVPIRIHNSLLVEALLYELESGSVPLNCDFDCFDLSLNPFLEKNLEFLGDSVDELSIEQNKFQQAQRAWNRQQQQRRGDDQEDSHFKQMPEPSRLDTLLIANQISSFCDQINQFAGHGLSQLYLLGSLHKPASSFE